MPEPLFPSRWASEPEPRRLAVLYRRLPPEAQQLVEAAALLAEPADPELLAELLAAGGADLPDRLPLAPGEIASRLAKLRELGLLTRDGQCRRQLLETAARRAADRPGFPGRADWLRKRTLASLDQDDNDAARNARRRDLRLAILERNLEKFHQALLRWHRLPKGKKTADPVARICHSPFDPEWFKRLPLQIQLYALSQTLRTSLLQLEPADRLLAYLDQDDWLARLPTDYQPSFFYLLHSQLLLRGKLKRIDQLAEPTAQACRGQGILGWRFFVASDLKRALAAFQEDRRLLQNSHQDRDAYFTGFEGLIALLALLQQEPFTAFRPVTTIVQGVERLQPHNPFLPAYQALRRLAAGLENRSREQGLAAASLPAPDGVSALILPHCQFWLTGTLNGPSRRQVRYWLQRAGQAGYDWLADQYQALLAAAGRTSAAGRAVSPAGNPPLVARIPYQEPWQRALRALDRALPPETAPEPEQRLVWWLAWDEPGATFSIQPRVQCHSRKGGWSKGRPIALGKLAGPERPSFLSDQDHRICQGLHRPRQRGQRGYRFSPEQALPAMIGHPLLFAASPPHRPLQLRAATPELLVEEQQDTLTVRILPEIHNRQLVVTREADDRFLVISVNHQQRRVAEILGRQGLRIPATARERLFQTLGNVSTFMTVHSPAADSAAGCLEQPAEPAVSLILTPHGQGLRVAMRVHPLGADGPAFEPGQGPPLLTGRKHGQRLRVLRRLDEEQERADRILDLCPSLAGHQRHEEGSWLLAEPEACLELLAEIQAAAEPITVEWPEGKPLSVSPPAGLGQLSLSIRRQGDWFAMDGSLRLDDQLVVGMRRLLAMSRKATSRFIPLGQGHFLTLSVELKKRLDELTAYGHLSRAGLQLHPLAALALRKLAATPENFQTDRHWRQLVRRARESAALSPLPPAGLRARLRDYQLAGYQWLARLAHLGVGACLADDMGLGKTLQALALLLSRAATGPALVVAPTSVCLNWQAEARRFAPSLRINLLNGRHRREQILSQGTADILVCSYSLLQQEIELLADRRWHTIVLDEAQAIKNILTKRSRAAMRLEGDFKLITTGTPIENHLSELWNLFQFINPGLLGSLTQFNQRFALPISRDNDPHARKRLGRLIRPFVLRRTKSEVLQELPPRTEITLRVDLGRKEAAFYQALRLEALDRLKTTAGKGNRLRILAEIMRLRRACCHPRLVAPEIDLPGAKLNLFAAVLAEIRENHHRSLVFSQFVDHLAIIRQHLDQQQIPYQYLDGKTPARERARRVAAFQAGEGEVFLISLKAGGLGLNLTGADYVIHLDPWWNPAVEDQASDRAHRIGQTRPVTVYRLITRGTIEEKILALHRKKRLLAEDLLAGTGSAARLSPEELLALLV